MAEIKGLEKFSSKDFPGHISSTVFVGGCNFRCPFCHNADLVLKPETLETLPMDLFLSYLDGRKGWLEGICLSGGEPLLHEDIETLIRVIKDRNLLLKIDTNGSFPTRLENIIEAELVDQAALDVKAPPEKYARTVRAAADPGDIARSAAILRSSGLPFVFRTTYVPGLLGREDMLRIGEWLGGPGVFQLQAFVPRNTLDPAFLDVRPFPREEMLFAAEMLRSFFSEVRVEGVES